jgi:hypothetical protein
MEKMFNNNSLAMAPDMRRGGSVRKRTGAHGLGSF